jgi:hypothetical protein
MVLTTLYTLCVVDSRAMKSSACKLTEKLDMQVVLLPCKLCQPVQNSVSVYTNTVIDDRTMHEISNVNQFRIILNR